LPILIGLLMRVTTADGSGRTRVLYLDEPYASVRWEEKWVVSEWKGYASSAEFRLVQETILLAVIENGAKRLLIDTQGLKVVLVDDERWMVTDLLTRLGRAGIRFVAVVIPQNQLARTITVDLAANLRKNRTWESELFDGLDEANAWLSSREASEVVRKD
jgi:hypothetical protein